MWKITSYGVRSIFSRVLSLVLNSIRKNIHKGTAGFLYHNILGPMWLQQNPRCEPCRNDAFVKINDLIVPSIISNMDYYRPFRICILKQNAYGGGHHPRRSGSSDKQLVMETQFENFEKKTQKAKDTGDNFANFMTHTTIICILETRVIN